MTCPACGSMSEPIFDLSPTGMVKKCGSCGVPYADQPPRRDMQEYPVVPDVAPVVHRPVPVARAQAAEPTARRLGAAGTIKNARAEERQLRATIKRLERELKKAKLEHTKLARLLDAADARPRAVVRPIKSA